MSGLEMAPDVLDDIDPSTVEDNPFPPYDDGTSAATAPSDAAAHDEPPGTDASASDPSVTFAEFTKRLDETNREALITADEGTMAPAGALIMLAATTGHGKTTGTVELVQHAAAGREYLGLRFPRPLNVLVIENEGPREAFREKLEARVALWDHGGEPRIWDVPSEWGQVRISNPVIRQRLGEVIDAHQIDLVVSDSLTRFGVRGNGTPEETRDFVEWLTELGLGRDVAFLLLHHPRTRPDHGEPELERIAGAWPPHADLIMLLQRLGDGRSRLSFPKTRWTKSQRPPCFLAFDAATESFTYVGVDEHEQRDLVAELTALMADGEWWAPSKLRKKKADGGVGAAPDAVHAALADERFESVRGDLIGKRKDATYYRVTQASRPPGDGRDAWTLPMSFDQVRERSSDEASPSPPRERTVGGDASSSERFGRDASGRDGSGRDDANHHPRTTADETCRRCGENFRRGSGNRGDLCGECVRQEDVR